MYIYIFIEHINIKQRLVLARLLALDDSRSLLTKSLLTGSGLRDPSPSLLPGETRRLEATPALPFLLLCS
jgi:hypothetical protein